MAAYKLTYFPCRARAEVIRLIFVQAGVEYENKRLGFFPFGSPEWTSMKKSEFPNHFLSHISLINLKFNLKYFLLLALTTAIAPCLISLPLIVILQFLPALL